MIKYESYCVDCERESYCFGNCCPPEVIFECDHCHNEADKLYHYDEDVIDAILYGGQELCEECFLSHFELIDEDNEIYLYEGKEIEKYDLLKMFEVEAED